MGRRRGALYGEVMKLQKPPASRPRAKEWPRPTRRAGVFTSIEETLLDAGGGASHTTRATIRHLLGAGVPVIPVDAMTLDEMAPLALDLGLESAMVVEAGGAIARPVPGGWRIERTGLSADEHLDLISAIEDRTGASLLVYSALPPETASRISGRQGERLRASTNRHFSEPFIIESGNLHSITRAASELECSICPNGSMFYLRRSGDEMSAIQRLRAELGIEVMIGIGSSLLDEDLLAWAEVPIIVPRRGGVDRELLDRVPRARIAPAPGPSGWTAAIEQAFELITTPGRRTRSRRLESAEMALFE